jgi:hypothetical protein
METKHFVIGIVVFVLIGVGIYYIGSMLSSIKEEMEVKDPIPASIGGVFESLDDATRQMGDAQRRQQEIIEGIETR